MAITNKLIFLSFFVLGAQGVSAATGMSIGAEYSEGDYGTGESTSSWYLPFGWHYSGGDFRADIIIPFVSVSGSSLISFDGRPLAPIDVGGGGSGGGGGATSTTRIDSGLGDVIVSGGYDVLDGENGSLWMGITARVKLGTADENKGLGSGENDYTLQLEAAKGMVYAYAGYTQLGDPATVNYNDVSFVGVALNFPLGDAKTIGLEYFTEEAVLDTVDAVSELTLSLSGNLQSDYEYSLFYTAGLSDSSADSVIGVNFRSPMR